METSGKWSSNLCTNPAPTVHTASAVYDITSVRICLVKQWPHITVYTAFYHYRLRKSMTFSPAGTIIPPPQYKYNLHGNSFFSQISFWVCLTVFIHCLAFAVICSHARLLHISLNCLDLDWIKARSAKEKTTVNRAIELFRSPLSDCGLKSEI